MDDVTELALRLESLDRQIPGQDMLTVQQVGQVAKVPTSTIYDALRDGRLKGTRQGTGWRVSKISYLRWQIARGDGQP